MGYFEEKVKRYYKLYKQNKPINKVYAVVENNGSFLVLKTDKGNYKHCLSGGSVDKGETSEQAIKRELLEELNVTVEIVKKLGEINYKSHWNYKGKEFDINNTAEIFYTKFIEYGNNNKFGLDGEFNSNTTIAKITKEEMLETVAEFKTYNIKLD